MLQVLHYCCSPHWHFVLACIQWRRTVQSWTVRRHWLQAKTKCQCGLQQLCNSCASLAGLVVSFIACFSLLVIAPLTLTKQIHCEYFETEVNIGCPGTDCIRCVYAVIFHRRNQQRRGGGMASHLLQALISSSSRFNGNYVLLIHEIT